MSRKRQPMAAGQPFVRGERGFTLIELMIALAMFSLVSLAGFTVLSSGQKSSVMNDEVVKMQQSVRLAVDLIARDIRMAGYGNPASPALVPLAASGCTSIINPADNNSTGLDSGPDSIAIITVDQVIGRLTAAAPGASPTTLTLDSTTGLSDNDVITLDGVFTARVTVNSNTQLTFSAPSSAWPATIQAPMAFNGVAGTGTQVVRLACVQYTVNATNRQLLRDGVAVVDGIEDLQLAYGVDADGDGKIDGLTGANGGIVNWAATMNPTTVRLVRINVVGRAGRSDDTFTSSSAVSVEDHNIASTTGFRRRVLTRTVSLRDLGL